MNAFRKWYDRMLVDPKKDERNTMLLCWMAGVVNALVAVWQVSGVINHVGEGDMLGAAFCAAMALINTAVAFWMFRLDKRRRKRALDRVAQQEAYDLADRKAAAEQEARETAEKLARQQELLEQQAVEKVEQQLTQAAKEQATLPEIFAERRKPPTAAT